jgi:ferrochelatase
VPWLEPDITRHLEELAAEGVTDVVVVPIGFVSDHMEVRFDLDVEAAEVARRLPRLKMVRAEAVGDHPAYIDMIVELIEERIAAGPERRAVGLLPPSHDVCARDCCPAPLRPGSEPKPAAAEA